MYSIHTLSSKFIIRGIIMSEKSMWVKMQPTIITFFILLTIIFLTIQSNDINKKKPMTETNETAINCICHKKCKK